MSKPNPKEEFVTYSSVQTRPEGGKVPAAQVRVISAPYGRKKRIFVHIREYYLRDDGKDYIIGRGYAFPPEALESIIQGLILAQEEIGKAMTEE